MSNAIAVLDAVRERVDPELMPQVFWPDLVLRQRRRALRGGAREAARDVDPVGRARARALRRGGSAPAALPLRRAGQLARADRGPAREQRAAHRARGARGHARAQRPGARHAAPRLERGARPAAAVGPAVVAAHPAGARLRDRPARVPRHLRGLEGDGRPRRGAARGGAGRDGGRGRARRRGRGRALHEGRARRLPPRAACAASSRRNSRVVGQNRFTESEDSPLTADAEGGILVVDPAVEAAADRGAGALALGARRRRRGGRRWPAWPRAAADEQREHHARDDRRGPRRGHHRRVGPGRCATCSAPTARRPASARPPRGRRRSGPGGAARRGRPRLRRRSAGG